MKELLPMPALIFYVVVASLIAAFAFWVFVKIWVEIVRVVEEKGPQGLLEEMHKLYTKIGDKEFYIILGMVMVLSAIVYFWIIWGMFYAIYRLISVTVYQ